jgi:(1->4)-alpha-D-glucan 1-alpha-D-glucosylmutase
MPAEWTGTYRLQLHAGFKLTDVERILSYLAELGVSHLYLSPCLQAAPGSLHGYDVTDPTRVSEDIGGESAWGPFIERVHAARLGVLLDIVPNHMAASQRNPWWDSLLAHGPFSPYAAYFDVRVQAHEPWRVHLCNLARPYGEALSQGEIRIEIEDGRPRVWHYDNSWPLGPASLGALLAAEPAQHGAAGSRGAGAGEREALTSTPDPSQEARARYARLVESMEQELVSAQRDGRLEEAVERCRGDAARLDHVLQRQFYVLHGWKLAGELTNYRRFFDVSALVGVRTEAPEVFEATHARIEEMIRNGDLDGLRIDHPDGLRDPRQYFERLHKRLPEGRIYIEKILESDERLVQDWPIDGTVGYDFLAKVNRLWMDEQRTDALTATYADFTGHTVNFAALVRDKKRQIVESTFSGDLDRLAAQALAVARAEWRTRDLSPRGLREALARVTTALGVYRTYRTRELLSAEDLRVFTEAVQTARLGSPGMEPAAFDFLGELFAKPVLTAAEAELIAQWQQLSPAVMAKGVEDTTFYAFDRLVSCNEVGAQASLVGISSDKFHEFCHYLSESWPNNLLATSTHDNKRSEDVRTRISLISEIPDRWAEAVHQWSQMNAVAWSNHTPDRHAEYLLYQTLVGAWPIDRERCWQYMQKACREAKIRTSWHEPNAAYEENIRGFIEAVLAKPDFIESLEAFIAPLIEPGRINSLAQTLIKMMAPGVPDFYQGTELWDLSLVDPDNRRPVDFERRVRLLKRCRELDARGAVADWSEGLPKLWLIQRLFALRRQRADDFARNSGYQPLVAQGSHLGNLFAFRRGENLIGVVPRFSMTLNGDWQDTRLPLPRGVWRNLFTEARLEGGVAPPDLFGCFPVAVLARDGQPSP